MNDICLPNIQVLHVSMFLKSGPAALDETIHCIECFLVPEPSDEPQLDEAQPTVDKTDPAVRESKGSESSSASSESSTPKPLTKKAKIWSFKLKLLYTLLYSFNIRELGKRNPSS